MRFCLFKSVAVLHLYGVLLGGFEVKIVKCLLWLKHQGSSEKPRCAVSGWRHCNILQYAGVSKNAKFRSQARMFLTSGYVRIVRVLVKSGCLHTLRSGLFLKRLMCFSSGWHVVEGFKLGVLRQHVLQSTSLLFCYCPFYPVHLSVRTYFFVTVRRVACMSRIMYELEVRQNRPTASTLSDIMQVQHMSRKYARMQKRFRIWQNFRCTRLYTNTRSSTTWRIADQTRTFICVFLQACAISQYTGNAFWKRNEKRLFVASPRWSCELRVHVAE